MHKNRAVFIKLTLGLVLGALALAGCSGSLKPAEVNPTDMPKGPGLFSGQSGNILDGFRSKTTDGVGATTNLGVNTYLWRAALETLSFMPIKTADSNGGVIATDWYTGNSKTAERMRANVLILGKKLQASGLQVTLFKEVKGKNGAWMETPTDPATARALEDTILTKARALRVSEQALSNN